MVCGTAGPATAAAAPDGEKCLKREVYYSLRCLFFCRFYATVPSIKFFGSGLKGLINLKTLQRPSPPLAITPTGWRTSPQKVFSAVHFTSTVFASILFLRLIVMLLYFIPLLIL